LKKPGSHTLTARAKIRVCVDRDTELRYMYQVLTHSIKYTKHSDR